MKKMSLILGMTLIASLAFAQEKTQTPAPAGQTSTVEKSELVPADKKMGDVDDEITNAKLRAETGSKSKYSFRSAFGVNGGTLQAPLGESRPDLFGTPNAINQTSVDGSIGMKYRMTERDNLNISTGVLLRTPFNRKSGEQLREDFNISGLSIDVSRTYKLGAFQMVSGGGFAFITDRLEASQLDSYGSFSFSQDAIYTTSSGWDLGASVVASIPVYKGKMRPAVMDPANPENDQDDSLNPVLSGGIYPFAEYAFSDTLTFRTLFGYAVAANSRGEPNRFQFRTPYQSVGLGISPTRDIYFYPNLQFNPGDMRMSRTNVALTMYINL